MAWTPAGIRRFVDRAFEVFGADRLMYGGDWPISVLAGGYSAVWDGLQPIIAAHGPEASRAVLGQTAIDCYGIDARRLAAVGSPAS
jgi:L-fuconolactonase